MAQPELETHDAAAAAAQDGCSAGRLQTRAPTSRSQLPCQECAQPEQRRDAAGPGSRDFADVGLGEDETQGMDMPTNGRTARTVLKAVFASNEEGGGEANEGGEGHWMEVDDPLPMARCQPLRLLCCRQDRPKP
ncbi:hypothetical protein EV715DRAFT_291646 [Schizophyllum commune]